MMMFPMFPKGRPSTVLLIFLTLDYIGKSAVHCYMKEKSFIPQNAMTIVGILI